MRESVSFATKRDAQAWAERRALELKAEAGGTAGERKTLLDAMRRYAAEVSPDHKGGRWECIRLEAMERDRDLPTHTPLAKLRPEQFNAWKAQRLKTVKPASVSREMGLISSVLGYARRDWGWMTSNPLSDVRRPALPPHRTRVISWRETKAMLRALGYTGQAPADKRGLVAFAFLLALRTGMRNGEVVGVTWPHVYASWIRLPKTKNGEARDVPLSVKTVRLVDKLRGLDPVFVLPIKAATRDVLFRRARDAAGIEGLTFHDTRHTAATRIGRSVGQVGRLSFPEFCKVFGWRDPKHALIYVNPTAAELAAKL